MKTFFLPEEAVFHGDNYNITKIVVYRRIFLLELIIY